MFDTPTHTTFVLGYLPFRLASVVANDANVANFSDLRLRKKLVDFFLVGLKVNASDQDGAIVAFGFLSLTLGLFQAPLESFLALALISFLVFITG